MTPCKDLLTKWRVRPPFCGTTALNSVGHADSFSMLELGDGPAYLLQELEICRLDNCRGTDSTNPRGANWSVQSGLVSFQSAAVECVGSFSQQVAVV